MSYTPHTWTTNETITAAKLNNLEDGVQEAAQSGGGGLTFIPWTFDDNTDNIVLSMTAQQIYDGMLDGTMYAVNINVTELGGWGVQKGFFVLKQIEDYLYADDGITFVFTDGFYFFKANTLSGYPSLYVGE